MCLKVPIDCVLLVLFVVHNTGLEQIDLCLCLLVFGLSFTSLHVDQSRGRCHGLEEQERRSVGKASQSHATEGNALSRIEAGQL